MRLTKYTHAAVTLERDGRRLLVDPGIWVEDEAFEGVDDVLVTHEHVDHLDVERVTRAASRNSPFIVRGPSAAVDQLTALGDAAVAVAPGESFSVAGFAVTVVGGEHAEIYPAIPRIANVGYLVDGSVYHPGDSFFVPPEPVATLLVPTSAPWLKLAEAIDFVRAVEPERAFSIHDGITNARGDALVDRLLGAHAGHRLPSARRRFERRGLASRGARSGRGPPPVSRTRSAAASSTSKPRRPAETYIVVEVVGCHVDDGGQPLAAAERTDARRRRSRSPARPPAGRPSRRASRRPPTRAPSGRAARSPARPRWSAARRPPRAAS